MAGRCIKAAVAVRRHLWSRSTLVNNATALLPSYAALHRGTTVCCMSYIDINRNCDSELVDTIDQYADIFGFTLYNMGYEVLPEKVNEKVKE